MEGPDYVIETYDKVSAKLAFGGGRGMLNLSPKGLVDIYFKKYDDKIVTSKYIVTGDLPFFIHRNL